MDLIFPYYFTNILLNIKYFKFTIIRTKNTKVLFAKNAYLIRSLNERYKKPRNEVLIKN